MAPRTNVPEIPVVAVKHWCSTCFRSQYQHWEVDPAVPVSFHCILDGVSYANRPCFASVP
ncbi:hypothetical protein N7486_001275 [Penicillium sp. IBT 16267x]|nr:hypothetical protein N7486_001275 [Penicillium sp. IBT 16267x]